MSEQLARRFHEAYERLAPRFGYETRAETRAFDPYTPNGRLMIAVCSEIDRSNLMQTNALRAANTKLVGALDMIRETLQGGNVEDLLLIINNALEAARAADSAPVEHDGCEACQRVLQWAEAYPLDVFPEPDFTRVADVLKAAGLSLDQVSASNMRHVITRVAEIVRATDSAPAARIPPEQRMAKGTNVDLLLADSAPAACCCPTAGHNQFCPRHGMQNVTAISADADHPLNRDGVRHHSSCHVFGASFGEVVPRCTCGAAGSASLTQETTMSEMIASQEDGRIVNNTMRHQYRVLSEEEKAQMLAIKDKGLELHSLIESLGASRELSIAKTKTEEAVMWAIKFLTR